MLESVFNKVAGFVVKKRLQHRHYLVKFTKFLRKLFFYRTPFYSDCFCVCSEILGKSLVRNNEAVHVSSNNFTDKSSRPEVFCKKGVLRNFTKFTGKHLRQSLFFNKVAGLGLCRHSRGNFSKLIKTISTAISVAFMGSLRF